MKKQVFPEDHFGKDREENKPTLYLHKKSGEKYRVVGSCINKDTDEFCLLYRKWNDFGTAYESLYCREYKRFRQAFEPYEYESLAIIPTLRQAEKNLKSKRK